MACNIPEAPKCLCTGKMTSVLKDKTGLWCIEFDSGKEVKRWRCQNKIEWKIFMINNRLQGLV